MDGERLTVRQKLGFGIFDMGGNLLFTLMGFWCLKYLTDVAGLGALLAGAAVMIGKAWDAVTDPMMGFISDRTLTPLGRRRPYLLVGAVPMMLSLWLFFSAPAIPNQITLMFWATGILMLVNTASTVINIPYSSLTPELTDDYHERTSLNGYRFGCAVFGTLIGAAAVEPLAGAFGGGGRGWSMMGLALGAVITLVTLLTFFGTKEKKHSRDDLPTGRFFATYRAVFTNRPYVILFLTYALHMTAITFLQSILAYYVEYLYPYNFELPGLNLTTISMLALLLTAMVFIPVSVSVSKKIGKKRTYQICFAVIGSACVIVAAAGHLLPPPLFLVLLAYAGVGVGFSYVAPFAMVPDTVEFDAVRTGERKEGAYYGMWTFISKVGTALSMLLSGLILKLGGYVANEVQGPGARLAIRLIIGPIPALIFLGALILMRFYTLDEKSYKKLMGQ
ncbi:MAG: MFS transporter [Treponema sp.]|jgi:GPH family glycoside/pentoside/hexuronide:cation symporter|nr:MFS transporter [Treponema sp.]